MDGDVAVYRRQFLNRSETFVRDHLVFLDRWRPTALTSWRQPDSLEVPGVDVRQAVERPLSKKVLDRLPDRLTGEHHVRRARSLRSALRRLRPDVVHAHFGTDAAVVAPVAAELGIPFVVTWHGYDATVHDESLAASKSGRDLLQQRSWLLREAAGTIAVSSPIARALVDRGAAAGSIDVIACGVDTRQIVPAPAPDGGGSSSWGDWSRRRAWATCSTRWPGWPTRRR